MVIYKKAQKVCGNGKVSIYYSLPFGWRKETDLIYEGIATSMSRLYDTAPWHPKRN